MYTFKIFTSFGQQCWNELSDTNPARATSQPTDLTLPTIDVIIADANLTVSNQLAII
jgi:hypothetical protein